MATNLHKNPSLGADATGYRSDAGTVARITATTGFPRTSSYQVTATASGNLVIRYGATATASNIAVTAGSTYAVSSWIKGSTARVTSLIVDFFDTSGAYLSSVTAASTTNTANTAARMSGTATAPANAIRAEVTVQQTGTVSGNTLEASSTMVEPGSTVSTNYSDGETAGWVWSGTRYNSTSATVGVGPGQFFPFMQYHEQDVSKRVVPLFSRRHQRVIDLSRLRAA